MLSKENKEKLVLTGLYKCQPNKKYRGQLYWNDMYHCFNWTFKVRYLKDDDIYLMVDTYFNEKCIELTDENFDEFEFLFDFNEVHEHSGNNIWEYNEEEDTWWIPQGWYEVCDYLENCPYIPITSEVIAWMRLSKEFEPNIK